MRLSTNQSPPDHQNLVPNQPSYSSSRPSPLSSPSCLLNMSFRGATRHLRSGSALLIRHKQSSCLKRWQSTSPTTSRLDIEALLGGPTWSVSSLLPTAKFSDLQTEQPMTSEKLHHLLRLSALEPPSTSEEEEKMLRTLSDQLHFVRAVQAADTTGVEPLRALRDESEEDECLEEKRVMKECEAAFEKEEILGQWHKRIRRRRDELPSKIDEAIENWQPVNASARKSGKYFLVER
jgi:Asp-tRNA(Asn)/Glu-tRNA(Gln) amidotransferase C subunit